MVSVSLEALKIVQSALKDFSTDITSLSYQTGHTAEEILNDGKKQIQQTKDDISKLETEIHRLSVMIEELEERIEDCEHQKYKLAEEQDRLEREIVRADDQITYTARAINSLTSQLHSLDENERDALEPAILGKIRELESQKAELEVFVKQANRDAAEMERKQLSLQRTIDESKEEKNKLEIKRNTERRRCDRMKTKLQNMEFEFRRVESYLNDYLSAVRRFVSNSEDAAGTSASAIDICISSIDEYMSIDL